MEVRKKSDAVRHDNSRVCIAFEYQMPTTVMDSAVIELSGRYPDEGWALNTVCLALVHVIQGRGEVMVENRAYAVEDDDQVLLSPNEKYAFHGDMKLLFSSSPAWTPQQAKNTK